MADETVFAPQVARPSGASIRAYAPRTGADWATIFGLSVAFALVAAAIFMGGSPGAFIDIPSVLIVLLGTVAVTMVSFNMRDMVTAQRVLAKTLTHSSVLPQVAARQMLQLAEFAYKQGPLSLQTRLPELRGNPFLYRSMQLASDGIAADDIEKVLRGEVEALVARHVKAIGILRRAADVAPSMGLIGTLIGLVQMLGNLSDPTSIGPSMAVALLTTFYGAVMSYMVLAPLAGKLERNSDDESLVKTLYQIAAVSIARKENPRRLEMLLNAVLPPAQRVRYFD